MTAVPPRKPLPRPGEEWVMAETMVALLADTPVRVLEVRDGFVHFVTASGVVSRFRTGTFTGVFDPAGAGEEPTA